MPAVVRDVPAYLYVIGLFEVETSPKKEQRKQLGEAIANINTKVFGLVGEKIDALKIKSDAITNELVEKRQKDAREEFMKFTFTFEPGGAA